MKRRAGKKRGAARPMAVHTGRRKKRGKPTGARGRGDRMLVQLVVCGLVLVAVVGVKLFCPEVLGACRERLGQLVGEDADFAAAFASVGRAMGGEGDFAETMGEAFVEAFGSQKGEIEGNNPGNTPGKKLDFCQLFQAKLPFFSAQPLSGTVESRFGWREHPVEGGTKFHYGVDVAAAEGTAIRCFADGRVTVVGESTTLGRYVKVAHDGGYATLYGHCQEISASDGQEVRRGEVIAQVGSTGQATGPHLHFELTRGQVYLNPIYYI